MWTVSLGRCSSSGRSVPDEGPDIPVPGRGRIPDGYVSHRRRPMPGGSVPHQRHLRGRGLISCLHDGICRRRAFPKGVLDDIHLPGAIKDRIVGIYKMAYARLQLPSHTILNNGLCLGLLDPVSNIILNTIVLLPDDSPPAANRPKKRSRPGSDDWNKAATRSYNSLVAFLTTYFRCVTELQAIRYLYRADANLVLAVMLVQHDLYLDDPAGLDPQSDRTQAALKWAATRAGHPSPSTLAQLFAIGLLKHDGGLDLVEKLFSGNGSAAAGTTPPITADDVGAIHRILHTMMSTVCVAAVSHTRNGPVVHVRKNPKAASSWSEATAVSTTTSDDTMTTSTAYCWKNGTPISSLQLPLLPTKLQDCLKEADGQRHMLPKTVCGDNCEYMQSLKMYLHGMIHDFYITALKLLPTPSGLLMRCILKAGHCYGSCDPVSNIIINSIWHDTCCKSLLPRSDRSKFAGYNDILDPISLLRPVVRSLEGLAKLALFADPKSSSSTACTMEKLCSSKCVVVVVDMLSSSSAAAARAREGRSEKKNPFLEAARTAGHPLPLKLAELHQQLQLMPVERNKLLSLITEARATGTVLPIDDIASILDMVSSRSSSSSRAPTRVLQVQAPELSVEALTRLSSHRLHYEEERSWLRSKIAQVLKEYTDLHFWEPNYKLDIIFGVEESMQGLTPAHDDMRYHVNFTATCDLKFQRTLFFAELFDPSSPESSPDFCCPLPSYPYAGCCYYDGEYARKIVYPYDAKYKPGDFTLGGTGSVDRVLDMDIVYFSPKLDVEVAENLNMLAKLKQQADSDYDNMIEG